MWGNSESASKNTSDPILKIRWERLLIFPLACDLVLAQIAFFEIDLVDMTAYSIAQSSRASTAIFFVKGFSLTDDISLLFMLGARSVRCSSRARVGYHRCQASKTAFRSRCARPGGTERGVLSEYPAARARASHWFDKYHRDNKIRRS